MTEALQPFIDRGEMPGLVARLGHESVCLGALSFDGPPMTEDAIFRIASISKVIVATAALILVDQRRIELDERLDALLPEFSYPVVLKRPDAELTDTEPARRAITLRDLLTCRMGHGFDLEGEPDWPMPQRLAEIGMSPAPPQPQQAAAPDEWMRRLGELPLMHHPGEVWQYNTASDALGVVLERLVGAPLDEVLDELIFRPLGMVDTGFLVPAEKTDRFTTAYWTNFETGDLEVYDPPVDGQWNTRPAFLSGAGGLVSTAPDLHRFGQALLENTLLKEETFREMITPQITDAQRQGGAMILNDQSWGLGLSIWGTRAGWDGGLGTSFYIDPTKDQVGILLTQQAWLSPEPPAIRRAFWEQAK